MSYCPLFMKIHHFWWCPVHKSSSFDLNVFFKYNNGLYRMMSSWVITLCSWKFTIFYGVLSISPVILITISRNLVTMFNTKKSFSNLIMVYIPMCHYELLPFVGEKRQFLWCGWSLNWVIFIRTLSTLFTMLSTIMSFPTCNIVHIAIFLQELLSFVH